MGNYLKFNQLEPLEVLVSIWKEKEQKIPMHVELTNLNVDLQI